MQKYPPPHLHCHPGAESLFPRAPVEAAALARDAQQLAPRALRVRLQFFPEAARVIFLYPRR